MHYIDRITSPGESVRFATNYGLASDSAAEDNLVIAEPIESLIFPRLHLVTADSAPELLVEAPGSTATDVCPGYEVSLIPGSAHP